MAPQTEARAACDSILRSTMGKNAGKRDSPFLSCFRGTPNSTPRGEINYTCDADIFREIPGINLVTAAENYLANFRGETVEREGSISCAFYFALVFNPLARHYYYFPWP